MNPDASRNQAAGGDPTAQPAEGVSQLIARIFDQLSVSAWLPATMLVGNVALLVRLNYQGNLNLVDATQALTQSPFGVLVALFLAIVLATMVSQAFAFEVIRVLEGYWDRPRAMAWLTNVRCGRHRKRMIRLQKRQKKIQEKAFSIARVTMLKKKIRRGVVQVQEDEVLAGTPAPESAAEDIADAAKPQYDWRRFTHPGYMRRFESLTKQFEQYPDPHRILPTRLGNTLRSAEDQLEIPEDEDLEGLVLRSYDRIPDHLRAEHDKFRDRLDMYCTLVFVFVLLAGLAVGLLSGAGGSLAAIAVGSAYAVLALTSYNAAIASARGYGSVLLTVHQQTASKKNSSDHGR